MATRTLGINAGANVTDNPKSLLYTLAELVNDAVASVNEQRTDHAAFKVTVDQLELLAEELAADHATQKVTTDQVETLIEELGADHATFKSAVNDLVSRLNVF